jgi:predicted nucleic acid-binding protein
VILTDTSVVIVYERAPTPRLRRIAADNDAAVCGVALAEMFAGVRTPADEVRCRTALADFQPLSIPETLWETVGSNQARLRANGVTVPLTDTVVASLAVALNLELWAYDAHFVLIQRILPALKLFHEPP